MKKASAALPDGFGDENEFIKDAREKHQEAADFDRENRDAAMEDLRFFAGEQWSKDDRKARGNRPCLTINQLPQFVAQVIGDTRINRPAIRVRPAEDADKDLASVREGLIRAIERDSDAQGVYASAGQAQVACGIGNFRVALTYANDDGFDRDIAIQRMADPFCVVWDPFSIEPTGKDARYCFVQEDMPRKVFEEAYPDAVPSDLEVSGDQQGWATRDTVRVTEYWIVKHTPTKLAMLEGGQVVEQSKVPPGAKVLQSRTVQRKSVCMYLINGWSILEGPVEYPISRLPVIRVQGWETNIGTKRVRWGLVRFARDPAKLKNYWRSVSAEMLALAPKGKWLANTDAINEDREDDFRKAATSADPLLLYEGNNPPQWIAPPQVPAAILNEAAMSAQDMKDVTGLHDASLGARSNETSGKAILARQKEGDVATFIYHDNLNAAIAEGGRVVNELIPITFDTARTIRVVGEDDAVKVQRINDPMNPDSVDINQGKYDVHVETGPSYSTKRVEAAESMMAFVQAVPQSAAITGDLIAKAQDWPMADIIAERLKKMIPPQILEGEEGQEPKQPDPMQVMQQQMAQEMATLELQIKRAEALEAEAKAAEAQAKALQANFESGHLIGSGSGPGIPTPEQPATGAMAA